MTRFSRRESLRRWWLQRRPHALIELVYVSREWGFKFAVNLEWHRRRFIGRILQTEALALPSSGPIEVHMLVNRSRSLEGIWTAKSFFWKSARRYPLVVHDDGSMTERDLSLWRHHFQNCRVIRRMEADRIIERQLAREYPRTLEWRSQFPLSLKLVDVAVLSRGTKIVVLDTDVLFSAYPMEFLSVAESPGNVAAFNSDCGGAIPYRGQRWKPW